MATFILLSTLCLQDVTPTGFVELNVPFSPREPHVLVDRDNNIWYQSYWDHSIYKLDNKGVEIFRITGPGNGPGEIHKPQGFALVNNDKWILVSHHQFIVSLFDSQTGKFIKDIIRDFPLARLFGWDNQFALALVDPAALMFDGFELINFRTGEIGKKWFKLSESRTHVSTSNMAFAKRKDHTIYYQPGALPEVYVVKPFQNEPQIWPLLPPPNYVEPPKDPLPESARYSREKVDAYYNSFTKVKAFTIIDDTYLLVCWTIQQAHYYQLYDLKEQKILKKDIPIKGLLVRSLSDTLYSLERIDPDDFDAEPKDLLHSYEINF